MLLAGALAFRLFVWLLPCSLLLTATLGFTNTGFTNTGELGQKAGLSPAAASVFGQIGNQAEQGRYLTAALGFVLLCWAGLVLARVLDLIHDRIWPDQAGRGVRQTLARAARYNLMLIAVIAANVAGPVVAASVGGLEVVFSVASLALAVAITVLMLSAGWPPVWRRTLPGACLVAAGMEGLHLVAVLYLPGKLARASQLYGTLGIAAALLVWLALIARLMVLGQLLNAVLAERATSSSTKDLSKRVP